MEAAGNQFSNHRDPLKYEEFCEKLRQLLLHAPLDEESDKDDCTTVPSQEIAKRIRRTNPSNKTDNDSYSKPTKNTTHTGHHEVKLTEICHNAWEKFSKSHQNLPMRMNNNVQLQKKHLRHRTPNTATLSNANISSSDSNSKQLIQPNFQNSTDNSEPSRSVIDERQRFHQCSHIVTISGLICNLFQVLQCLTVCVKNTQDLIYPFMRSLRLYSIPIVSRFPRLTDLYEESCLLVNPFYTITDLDCWPCEGVRNVIDLTGFSNFSSSYYHSGIPFIVKHAYTSTYQKFGMEQLETVYTENLDRIGKPFVETNAMGISTLDEVFKERQLLEASDFHLKWEINRVTTARVWRSIFPKPYFIPAGTEVSVQHFLFIDADLARSYSLPFTEFANVFMIQTSGVRSVVLIPTESCRDRCRVVSAILQPKDILFYNWLFWRPVSVPAKPSDSKSMSIAYIGSFY